MTVSDIIQTLSAQLVVGSLDTPVSGFAALGDARAGDLSFFADARYRQALADTKATVILVPEGWDVFPDGTTCLAVANPSEAFCQIADQLGTSRASYAAYIHPTAVIGSNVTINLERVSIGANAVIDDGAQIGDDVEIGAGCYVGRGAQIGAQSRLFANVTVSERCIIGQRVLLHSGVVIGADGFGYRFEKGRHQKVPQNGIVQIEDDVEIGANSTIDRARIGKTTIGEGTKIDNLVQIGHNVTVGKHCIIVSQSGIAGSSTLGDYVVVAAQAGIAGHVSVGSMCTIGARTVVSKSLPEGKVSYLGFPAAPAMQERKRLVASKQLPELLNRVKQLETEVKALSQSNGSGNGQVC